MRSGRKNAREQRAQQLSSTFTPFSFQNSDTSFSFSKPQPAHTLPNPSSLLPKPMALPSTTSIHNSHSQADTDYNSHSPNPMTIPINTIHHTNYDILPSSHSLTQMQFNAAQIQYYQQLRAAYIKQQEDKKMRGFYLDTMLQGIAYDYLSNQDIHNRQHNALQKHNMYIQQQQKCIRMRNQQYDIDNKPTIVVIKHKEIPKLQPSIPKLSIFIVQFTVECVRIDTDQQFRQLVGQYQAGYVNPYKQSSIDLIADIIISKIEGVISSILQNVNINDNSRTINMKITVFMEPLQLNNNLQYTFISYQNNIIQGLRIQCGNVQISWAVQVQSNGFDIIDQISIQGNSVKLSKRLAKGATIIYRCLQLKEQNLQQFLKFYRNQCPGLAQFNIGNSFYDKQLNIGMIYIS